jgi:hypothetical protein
MRFLLPIPFIQWIAGTQTSCCVRAFSANLSEQKAVDGFAKGLSVWPVNDLARELALPPSLVVACDAFPVRTQPLL